MPLIRDWRSLPGKVIRVRRFPRWVNHAYLMHDLHRLLMRKHGRDWSLRRTARRLEVPASEVSKSLQVVRLMRTHPGMLYLHSRDAAYRYVLDYRTRRRNHPDAE